MSSSLTDRDNEISMISLSRVYAYHRHPYIEVAIFRLLLGEGRYSER